MTLQELVIRTRSYRRFDEKFELSVADLRELVNLARYTSSARNAQALKYLLITNKSDCAKIFPFLNWAG